MRAPLLALLASVGCGCAAEPAKTGCPAGTLTLDGSCVPKLQDCPAATLPRADGCTKVGVTACAPGFVADDEEGCRPLLPETSCASGTVAWLGDAACHPLVDCGTDKYGTPPADRPIVYVDAATGASGDGTEAAPFKTIGEALTAARPASTIAIAEGLYDEELVIRKDVRLWGRCPQKVAIAPTAPSRAYAVTILATPASIQRVAVSGGAGGVLALDTVSATVEDSWVHDTADSALSAQGDEADGALLARRVLVERARDLGVYALGGTITLESSSVRDTRSASGGVRGYGVGGENRLSNGKLAHVVVRGSIVERNRDAGVFVIGGTAKIEGSLVRDTLLGPEKGGFAAWAQADDDRGVTSSMTIERSVLSGSVTAGVHAVKGELIIRDTAILRTRSRASTRDHGLCVFSERATLTMTDSLCRWAQEIGVEAAGGAARIERVAIRDITPNAQGQGGVGLGFVHNTGNPQVEVLDTGVSNVVDSGVIVFGGDAILRGCAIRDVTTVTGSFGDGVSVAAYPLSGEWAPSSATVEQTVIERVARGGIAAFALGTVSLRDVRLACTGLPLIGSARRGTEPEPLGPPAQLVDLGGVVCGCGDQIGSCKASYENLSPTVLP